MTAGSAARLACVANGGWLMLATAGAGPAKCEAAISDRERVASTTFSSAFADAVVGAGAGAEVCGVASAVTTVSFIVGRGDGLVVELSRILTTSLFPSGAIWKSRN